MKRFTLTCILTLCVASMAFAIVKSQVVVYINGEKYYIHTVQSKETLYSIAKTYEVDEQVIIDLNSAELKAGENIKIPYPKPTTPTKKSSGLLGLFTFSKHTIKKGDTLYSISRKYEISIATIMEDNPSIDPLSLPEGSKLLIRKKMKGKNSEEQSQAEWEDYRADLNLATESDGYRHHIVEKGETIYSLTREMGVTEAELRELNDLEHGLKAGAIIKLPLGEQTEVAEEQGETEIEPETTIEQIGIRALAQGENLKVALLLPLSNGARVQQQFADFYKGFEAGLDSIRTKYGRQIELTLYNTERNVETVGKIVESSEFEGTNLIVGPIYEELLSPVLAYAEQNHTPVVSPLAVIKEHQSSVLFQLAPPQQSRYDKVKEMFADTRHVTLIYTEQTDSTFEANIMKLLGNREYETHKYKYEHPNEVAVKIKNEKESAGDLSRFINNDKNNTIVVMSSNQTDVDRILSALSSAQINIVARGGDAPRYEVLGNPEWSRYNNIDRTILFKNNVVLISTYNAKRNSTEVKAFDSNYIKRHNALPTLYAYRGYDAAIIFGQGMYSEMQYNLEGRTFTPLQSQYRFETDAQSGIHTNVEWIKINYKNDYTITIE